MSRSFAKPNDKGRKIIGANNRSAGQPEDWDKLSAIVAADRAFSRWIGLAVLELLAQITLPPPMKPRHAVIAAFVGQWLFASLGVFIVFRFGQWTFIPSGNRVMTIAQLSTFYSAFYGAQLPAVAPVSFLITHSTIRHPILMASVVTIIYQVLMSGLRSVRRPWGNASDVQWWMPVWMELSGILFLVFLAMVMAWIFKRSNNPLHATARPADSEEDDVRRV